MSIVPIRRAGVLAQQFCGEVADARIEAVFARSLYLRAGDRFVCIGGPEIGNGPFTLTAELDDLRLQRASAAAVCDRHITIGEAVIFTLDQSESWRSPAWLPCVAPARLIETGAMLARCLAAGAPPEALARQPFAPTRIARFESRLSDVLRHGASIVEEARGLIGLGPGLTPSGDDFLVGALATLEALGEDDAHAALARAITAALPGATSALSACFLRAAAGRHIGEHLHRMVSSVIAGDVDGAGAAAASIGHSSGWDMLAGITSTLQTVTMLRFDRLDTRRRPRRRPAA
jgi:hypothetical protein